MRRRAFIFSAVISLCGVPTIFAGSLRTSAAVDRYEQAAASNTVTAAEKDGTILTESAIKALVDGNKTKEALSALLARQAAVENAKSKAKDEAQKAKSQKGLRK